MSVRNISSFTYILSALQILELSLLKWRKFLMAPSRQSPIGIISDSLKQICTHIEIMQSELESETNHQRASLPKLIDRKAFWTLAPLSSKPQLTLYCLNSI